MEQLLSWQVYAYECKDYSCEQFCCLRCLWWTSLLQRTHIRMAFGNPPLQCVWSFWCFQNDVYFFLGAHEALAFDNGVPPYLLLLVSPGAKHAKAILNLRMTRIIALGVHFNDALMEAAKSGYPRAIIKHLPHLTCMSIYLCGAKIGEEAAASCIIQQEIWSKYTNWQGSYIGRLFMDYCFASYPGGQGGPLDAICFEHHLLFGENFQYCKTIVHHLVAALCTTSVPQN